MKICKMTATFGKLRHQELVFEDGLNIIHAPNEWGKSTWCAFLIAMLYGIDTSARRNRDAGIPDKVRYAPWTGEPMSGSMEILWNGRRITIERRSEKRAQMGLFRAFDTDTGVDIPELTGENCGVQLLGVEKSVFLRSGFLKLSDLPVTQDEAFRRRLNALVTTGDESDAADSLAGSLRDLKNRCKHNRTGKLPDAQRERAEVAQKLESLHQLNRQAEEIVQHQRMLEKQCDALKNHLQALAYQDSLVGMRRYTQAQIRLEQASDELHRLEDACKELPEEDALAQELHTLRTLQTQRDSLRTQAQPPLPRVPDAPAVFQGMSPAFAVAQAQKDAASYGELQAYSKWKVLTILGLILAVLGICALTLPYTLLRISGAICLLIGIVCVIANLSVRKKAKQASGALAGKYTPLPPDRWEAAAQEYARACRDYEMAMQERQSWIGSLSERMRAVEADIHSFTGGSTITACEEKLRQAQELYRQLDTAKKLQKEAADTVEALSGTSRDVLPPATPDTVTLTREETEQALQSLQKELIRLHSESGICQGKLSLLGQESVLQEQLCRLDERIFRLEETYRALELALDTVEKTKADLQDLFSRPISAKTKAIFSQLTGGRYNRLKLESDLSLSVAADGEDTLTSLMFRSDGTADQLYLALRLAAAQELTPDAPMILDDALVRFDDIRLAAALKVLQDAAENKQIILFTCQLREQELMKKSR